MERPVFVAREQELERLDSFLDKALAGQGAVCFVTGEAGSGKTALVTELARRAQQAHDDLVVAAGQSDAQTGIGDPYLPFREVLAQLTGDVEAKLAQGAITEENASRLRKLLAFSGRALVEVGPDLIELFVPWVGLATRAASFAADKVGWLDRMEQLVTRPRGRPEIGQVGIEQEHIFEQYTNVLNQLAAQQPLLVVLDDLQWADAASIGLLFRLGRRIGGSRILIMGTYRPEEVALGRAGERHPLEKVLAEFKRYFGDISVDLDQAEEAEGQRFVAAFLDTEPNRLGERFRRALYQHTGGHPLFTIELLRDMQERGDLVQDEQRQWVEGSVLDWHDLPDRVEAVIEERIGRLEDELRRALMVGSVEGEDFTAEVVAQVQAVGERRLIQRLSGELQRQHRLVSARGVRRLNGQRLSLYRFQHNLFQKYLYGELGEAERAYLHEDVGCVLEALYGDQADEIAVQLARHFEEADIPDRACHYLCLAGEQAAARFANDEAIDYLGRALDLTPETDISRRYTLLLVREMVYALQGEREAQERDIAALETLAEALDDDSRRAEVAIRRALHAKVTGDYAVTVATARSVIGLAQSVQDASLEAGGYLEWGTALWPQGAYEEAREQIEKALSLARVANLRVVEAECLHNLGIVSFNQGDFAAASAYENQALGITREIGYRRGETGPLNVLGGLYAVQGDYARASAYCEQALRINREIGDRRGEGVLLSNLGELTLVQGDYAGARLHLEQALSIYDEIDDVRGRCHVLAHLGLLFHHLGKDEDARDSSQEALSLAQKLHDSYAEGHALARLGHALAGLGDLADAAGAYRDAMAIWRESGPPSLAMEALAGLARISLAQEDLGQAEAQVEEILSYLEDSNLGGADEPFRVYLTCYRVLCASDDARAQAVLDTAYTLLQEHASRISDEEMRHSFLENVPAHQEILSEVAKGQ